MKYKVGDKVKIVSEKTGRHWNYEGKMDKFLGQIGTISFIEIEHDYYGIKEFDNNEWCWCDHMIEGLAEKSPKEMLETGMVVETRNGEKFMVLKGEFETVLYGKQDIMFVRNDGFFMGSNFNENLEDTDEEQEFDIMKISKGSIAGVKATLERAYEIVWERKEKTLEEIEREENLKLIAEMESKLKELKAKI